jgi:hypothetical protein
MTISFGPAFSLPPVRMHGMDTPIGVRCSWCAEPFLNGDQGVAVPSGRLVQSAAVEYCLAYYHRWCFVRTGVGSVGHQQAFDRGDLDCSGHLHAEPPEQGTPREHAVAAATYFYGGTLPD